MRRTIVVATHGDDDHSRDAVALATRLARLSGARLVLAGVWSSPLGPADEVYARAVGDALATSLERLHSELPVGVEATVQVRSDSSVPHGLHSIATETGAELLVLGPSHRGRMARFARGTVAAVLHDAPCAVAVAPAGYRDVEATPADVVVAWDGSAEARMALDSGVAIAQQTGGTVRLIYVMETPAQLASSAWVGAPAPQEWFDQLRERAHEIVAEGEDAVAGRAPASTHVVEGRPGLEISRLAGDAALAVVGSRGYGSMRRIVLGSVSSELVAHGSVPVLVVPRSAVAAPVAGDALAPSTPA